LTNLDLEFLASHIARFGTVFRQQLLGDLAVALAIAFAVGVRHIIGLFRVLAISWLGILDFARLELAFCIVDQRQQLANRRLVVLTQLLAGNAQVG